MCSTCLLPAADCPELHPVLDQSRLELHREGIGLVGRERLGFGLERACRRHRPSEIRRRRRPAMCRCNTACLRSCRRGRRTGRPRASRPSGLRGTHGSLFGSVTTIRTAWVAGLPPLLIRRGHGQLPAVPRTFEDQFPGCDLLESRRCPERSNRTSVRRPSWPASLSDWRSAARLRSSRGRPTSPVLPR